ncbi:MAG: hypothetical protein IT466_05620 [Moraxellaceae bacterium]|nr:hypothetical protein [Moraxellaceae bacterium]
MSNDATKDITWAYWDLGDYFSRLGGAGRYWNMPESDIPLFIGCELAKKISSDFDETEYLNGMFLDAAAPVLDKIRSRLDHVEINPEELSVILMEFLTHIDSKYSDKDRSKRWEQLLEWARLQASNFSQ